MAETRIIIAQGPFQILSAISILRARAYERPERVFKDILILGDYCGPNLDRECLEVSKTWNFSGIFSFHEFEKLFQQQQVSFQDLITLVRNTYQIENPSEIYVCRNWQLINETFLAAYPETFKVCYGDGFGGLDLDGDLNGFGAYHPPIAPINPAGFIAIDESIVTMLIDAGRSLSLSPVRQISPRFFEETIRAASEIEEIKQYCRDIKNRINTPIKLVLTSTLTQSSMCKTVDDEIEIYLSLVLEQTDPTDTILIKGHPREIYGQSRILETLLKQNNRKAELVEDRISRYPSELLAMNLPVSLAICLGSSSCIVMAYFNCCDLLIGYGEDILSKYFPEHIKTGLLKYEYANTLLSYQGYCREFHPVMYREINNELDTYGVYHKKPVYINSTAKFNLYEYLKICSTQHHVEISNPEIEIDR